VEPRQQARLSYESMLCGSSRSSIYSIIHSSAICANQGELLAEVRWVAVVAGVRLILTNGVKS